MADDTEYSPYKKGFEKSSYNEYREMEIAKCILDPFYFIENYVIVNEPSKGDVPFILFPYQRKIINGFANFKNVILMCGRQQGKCVTYDTYITKNNSTVKIGDEILNNLSFKDRIVTKLENLMIKLSK